MPRIVLDTVVFVRALINPGGLWGSLIFGHTLRYRLIVSEHVVSEVVEVLERADIVRKFAPRSGMDYSRVLDILGAAEVVALHELPAVSRDPKDDKFLATARAAQADYLVSEDRDLLVLGEDEGTRIVTARDFLEILEGYSG